MEIKMNQKKKDLNKFTQELKEFLKKREKLVILGIGNSLRGDDYSGSFIASKLSQNLNDDNITVIDGGTVPENYTGLVRKENPSHIILLDAADMKKTPGFIKLIKKEEISRYNISTHAMSLSFLIKYLEHTTNARIMLIGIQPREMELTEKISPPVKESIDFLIELFHEIL